jgi:hypothetical protein
MADWKRFELDEEEQIKQKKYEEREPELYPDDQAPQIGDIEYYEYECGMPCTVNGCCGHTTDLPVGILVDNVMFFVEGFEGGDFPQTKAEAEEVKSVVRRLDLALKKMAPTSEDTPNWSDYADSQDHVVKDVGEVKGELDSFFTSKDNKRSFFESISEDDNKKSS